jgi:hypothetical protein
VQAGLVLEDDHVQQLADVDRLDVEGVHHAALEEAPARRPRSPMKCVEASAPTSVGRQEEWPRRAAAGPRPAPAPASAASKGSAPAAKAGAHRQRDAGDAGDKQARRGRRAAQHLRVGDVQADALQRLSAGDADGDGADVAEGGASQVGR